jgi:hypothetical protein
MSSLKNASFSQTVPNGITKAVANQATASKIFSYYNVLSA